jgi:hypothetical protein
LEILVGTDVIVLPKKGPHLSDNFAILFFNQIGIAMSRVHIMIEFIHFSPHPKRTFVPVGQCFSDAFGYFNQREGLLIIYCFRHDLALNGFSNLNFVLKKKIAQQITNKSQKKSPKKCGHQNKLPGQSVILWIIYLTKR